MKHNTPNARVFINKARKQNRKSYKVSGNVSRIRKKEYSEDWPTISRRIMRRDGYRCVQCTSTKQLEVHHILPLSRGGTNRDTNLITLCETCHNKRHKHKKVPSLKQRKSKHGKHSKKT